MDNGDWITGIAFLGACVFIVLVVYFGKGEHLDESKEMREQGYRVDHVIRGPSKHVTVWVPEVE